ncbi:MarR family winged helix-turn-helix transcriptional regulator [Vibrio mediterranei]|uniref:MarR family transcriptional regulator n=1 Tax=Vibrio mediterranei TaxID=689 RepID=A0AAN1KQP5_9VIBR|nr:MarR family transcriptional regulator [Vibrio mediterranei]ASI92851.1 MarR family transcriptional regulator [Vibrio mediterranei]
MSENTSLESIFRLVHTLKRQMSEQIESLDCDVAPMHIRVMKIITKRAPCTSIDIANLLSRDKAQVTRLINTLISEGLLEKAPNPEDKRSHFLILTPAGETIMSKVAEIDKAMLLQMTAGIDKQDLAKFAAVADAMTDNLAN